MRRSTTRGSGGPWVLFSSGPPRPTCSCGGADGVVHGKYEALRQAEASLYPAATQTVASIARSPMICPACGRDLVEGDRFCGSCGRSLQGSDQGPVRAPTATPNPPDPDPSAINFRPSAPNLPLGGRPEASGSLGDPTPDPETVGLSHGSPTSGVQCPNCGGTDVATLTTWPVDPYSGAEVKPSPPIIEKWEERYLRSLGLPRAVTWLLFFPGAYSCLPVCQHSAGPPPRRMSSSSAPASSARG
jgi:ribosomal protein S27E